MKLSKILNLVAIGLALAGGVANAQSYPTNWKSFQQTHNPADIISSTEVAEWFAKKQDIGASLQTTPVSGYSPQSLDARLGYRPVLADYGVKGDGTVGDQAAITAAYNATPQNGVLVWPCSWKWPNNADGSRWAGPHTSGKQVRWDMSCAANWATNQGYGTQMDTFVGDGDVTVTQTAGGLWLSRADHLEDNGQPVLNVTTDDGPHDVTCLWPGGVTCNEQTVAITANIEDGSTVSREALELTVNNHASNPWIQQPQGLMIHANADKQASMWPFAFEYNDNSHLPPVTFSQTGEFDAKGTGDDSALAEYKPSEATRKLMYVSPVTYGDSVGQYTFSTTYKQGDLVAVGDSAGKVWLYQATNAGTSSASIVPSWKGGIGDTQTDNGITWECINSYYYHVGDGLWFNHDPGTTPAYFDNMIAGNAIYTDAAINTSQMTPSKSNSAAIRMGSGQFLDFSGDLTEAGKNKHVLVYSTYAGDNSLVYSANGSNVMWLKDIQEALFTVPMVVQGGCNPSGKTPDLGIEQCNNAHTVGDADIVAPANSSLQLMARSSDGTIPSAPAMSITSANLSTFLPLKLDNGHFSTDGSGNVTTDQTITAGAIVTSYNADIHGVLHVYSSLALDGGCSGGIPSSVLSFCAEAHSVNEGDLIIGSGHSLQFMGSTGTGTGPMLLNVDPSANVVSVGTGFVLYGQSTADIIATASPTEGMIKQDTTAHTLDVYENGHWYPVSLGAALN